MAELKQPILYNGFLVARKYSVINRIHSDPAFEVYVLDQERFLVLFLNNASEFLEESMKLRLLKIGQSAYHYSIFDQGESKRKVIETVSNLIYPKGLQAIAGMADLKKTFENDVIAPIRDKEKYQKFKIALPNAILLFGPPGCGKTYFVKKIAEELKYHFIDASPSSFSSSYIHGTSLKIRAIFDEAREKAPSLIFIDEIDSLFPKRENIGSEQNYKQEEINEFLVQMNDISEVNVLLIGATNQPNLLDDALLRTGRIDKLIYVGLPDYESRKSLFMFYLRERPTQDIDYDELASSTDNFTCSDIEYICNEASKNALQMDQESIRQENLVEIIQTTRSSVSDDMMEKYQRFQEIVRK